MLLNNGVYIGVGNYDVDDMMWLVKCLYVEIGNFIL